jgi:GxxExxY protein
MPLAYELSKRGVHALPEVPVPVVYDGRKLADVGYRVDLLVENELILEVKSVEAWRRSIRRSCLVIFGCRRGGLGFC